MRKPGRNPETGRFAKPTQTQAVLVGHASDVEFMDRNLERAERKIRQRRFFERVRKANEKLAQEEREKNGKHGFGFFPFKELAK